MITQECLRSIFDYQDGQLVWAKQTAACVKIGEVAGSTYKDGYVYIQVNKKIHKAHRLIFLYHYGWLPDEIDHIDRNRSNNKIENLRAATKAQNMKNKSLCKTNKSGVAGVGFHKRDKTWQAAITYDKTRLFLGSFKHLEDAIKARKEAEMKYFGKFAPR